MSILSEIIAEQRHGRKKWGGSANNTNHDDSHQLLDWLDMIEIKIERCRVATPTEARQELIKIAGLAKSAVESFDRKVK